MSVAFQNFTAMTQANGGPVWQDSYTMPSVSNGILFVALQYFSGSRSSITYNSVAMTKIGSTTVSGGQVIEVWYLVNPSSGSNFIQLTGTGIQDYAMIAYSGASQVSPINASASQTATSTTSFTASVTSTVANCWIVQCVGNSTGAAISAGAGTTQRGFLNGSGTDAWQDSNVAVVSGSNSLVATSTSANFGSLIIALAPVPVSSSAFFEFM